MGKYYIDPNEFAKIVEYLKPFIDKAYSESCYGGPSYFEIFLAIALLYFKKQNCEWVVLEVGLGGSYDATNVIENPVITAITNICREKNVTFKLMNSGAAHDAQEMAQRTQAGMIFLPSVNGVSHSPKERIEWNKITLGLRVLTGVLKQLSKK